MKSGTGPIPLISILIVEDEEQTRELLANTLSRKFLDVAIHTTGNGRTGLELFRKLTPEIVITDINMPEMGGFQLVFKIRSLKPETKLIVLTGCAGEETMKDAVSKEFEIDHFILKPVVLNELFAAVEQCIGGIVQHQT